MSWLISVLLVAGIPSLSVTTEGVSDAAKQHIEEAITTAASELDSEDPGSELRVRALGGAMRVMITLERLGSSGVVLDREELYLEPSLEGLEARIGDALLRLWPTRAPPFAETSFESGAPATVTRDAGVAPLVLASGGVLAIIGGIVLATHSSGLGSDLSAMPLVDETFRDVDAERKLTASLSYGLFIGGTSCLVSAVLLEVLDP